MSKKDLTPVQEYEKWLVDLVSNKDNAVDTLVMWTWFAGKDISFVTVVNNDVNRQNDVIDLRNDFANMRRFDESDLSVVVYPINMFEIMVLMAKKMADIGFDYEEDRTPEMFRVLLKNLGVTYRTTTKELSKKLLRVNNRTYEVNGEGGLFPLKDNGGKDQVGEELWYQMHAWLAENDHIFND